MTLTKARIVEAVFAANIFTKTHPARISDTLFELITLPSRKVLTFKDRVPKVLQINNPEERGGWWDMRPPHSRSRCAAGTLGGCGVSLK